MQKIGLLVALGGAVLALSAMATPGNDTIVFIPGKQAKAGSLIEIPDRPNPGGDAAVIDLLIVYTPRFQADLNAEDRDIVSFAEGVVAEVNRFMRNSRLATRIELVGLALWNRSGDYDIRSDLEALPAFVETQTSLRAETGADLVQLWERPAASLDEPGLCGWGQVMSPSRVIATSGYGYSAGLRGTIGSDFESCYADRGPEDFAILAAHEIGHNLGSTHGWDDVEGQGAFEFSRGAYCGEEFRGYQPGTLMSSSPWRLPFFSNPQIGNDGEACGRALGLDFPANNFETFSRTASHIGNLRHRPEGRGEVSLSAPASVAELSPWLPLTLARSDSSQAASVELLTTGRSARLNLDFLAPASQRIYFAAGQSTALVPIDLIASSLLEADEHLSFWLQRGYNVKIGAQRSATVRIRDNALPNLDEILPPRPTLTSAADLPGYAVSPTAAVPASGATGTGALAPWLLLIAAARWRRTGRRTAPCVPAPRPTGPDAGI